MNLAVKRAYDPVEPDDGLRILVDRVWPRGLSKDKLALHAWMKEVAPSTELRKWFGHDPEKWEEFQRRYFAELDGASAALRPLVDAIARANVTLVYSAADRERNQAVALRAYLRSHLG